MNASRIWTYLEFPLLRREFVGLLRTKTAFFVLPACVFLTAFFPLLRWPGDGPGGISWYSNLLVFTTFFLTQLSVALLAVPAFTAGAISGERERGTYDLLYTTLLPPVSIIFSKTLASSGYVLILLAATAPIASVAYLVGGLAFGTILRCYAVTVAAVVLSCLVCLAQSMRCRRTSQAAVRGVLRVAFYNGLGAVAIIIVLSGSATGVGFYLAWCASPFTVITTEILGSAGGGPGRIPGAWPEPWIVFLGYAGLVSGAYLVFLLRAVRTPDLRPSWLRRGSGAFAFRGVIPMRLRRSFSARILLARSKGGRPLVANPVFRKELQSEFFAQPRFRRFFFWGPLLFCAAAGLAAGGELDPEGVLQAVSMGTVVLLGLLVPSVCAGAFTREIEHGNRDFLRATGLSMERIFRGKLLAGLYAACGLPAAGFFVVLGTFVAVPAARRDAGEFIGPAVLSGAIVVTTWILLTQVSLFASVVSKRTLRALLLAFGLLVAAYVVFPVLVAMGGGGEVADFLVVTHPLAALLCAAGDIPVAPQGTLLFPLVALMASAGLWVVSVSFLEGFWARDGS